MDDKRQEEVVGKNLILPGLEAMAVKAFLAEDNLRPVGNLAVVFVWFFIVFRDVQFENSMLKTGDGFVGQVAV